MIQDSFLWILATCKRFFYTVGAAPGETISLSSLTKIVEEGGNLCFLVVLSKFNKSGNFRVLQKILRKIEWQ